MNNLTKWFHVSPNKHFFMGKVKIPVRGLMCAVGGFILLLSFAIQYSYANLNTYMISYMRTTGYNDWLTYADFVFVGTTNTIVNSICNPFMGELSRRIGSRKSVAIGSFIYSLGIFLTYFSVKSYFYIAVLTMNFHAVGYGFCYGTAVCATQSWFPAKYRGFVGSIVVAGYGYGALIWVPLQTRYVNPDNIAPVPDPSCANSTEQTTCFKYFTDPDLLAAVPSMFFLLGGIYFGFGLVATLLISDPPATYKADEETEENPEALSDKESQNHADEDYDLSSITTTCSTLPDSESDATSRKVDAKKQKPGSFRGLFGKSSQISAGQTIKESSLTSDLKQETIATVTDLYNQTRKKKDPEQLSSETKDEETTDLTPLQLLKTKSFYLLWIAFLAIHLLNGIQALYSKTLGQNFINDDHYFYKVSIIANILNGTCRMGWGLLYDRLKFRNCYLIVSTVIIFVATLPTLRYLGEDTIEAKVLYGIWTCVIYGGLPCLYVIVVAVTADLYGKTHYKTNFGLVITANFGTTVITLIITKTKVYDYLGQDGLFYFGAVAGIFGILSALGMPNQGKPIRLPCLQKSEKSKA